MRFGTSVLCLCLIEGGLGSSRDGIGGGKRSRGGDTKIEKKRERERECVCVCMCTGIQTDEESGWWKESRGAREERISRQLLNTRTVRPGEYPRSSRTRQDVRRK